MVSKRGRSVCQGRAGNKSVSNSATPTKRTDPEVSVPVRRSERLRENASRKTDVALPVDVLSDPNYVQLNRETSYRYAKNSNGANYVAISVGDNQYRMYRQVKDPKGGYYYQCTRCKNLYRKRDTGPRPTFKIVRRTIRCVDNGHYHSKDCKPMSSEEMHKRKLYFVTDNEKSKKGTKRQRTSSEERPSPKRQNRNSQRKEFDNLSDIKCDSSVALSDDILLSNDPLLKKLKIGGLDQIKRKIELTAAKQGADAEQDSNGTTVFQQDPNGATVTQQDPAVTQQDPNGATVTQQDPAVTQQDPNGTTVTEQDSSAVIRKNASIGVMTTSEQDSNVAVPMLLNSSSDRTMIQDVNADIGMNAEVSGNEPQCDGFVVYEYDILVSNKPVKQPNSETEVLMTEQGSNVVMTQKDSNAATVTQSDVVMADQGSDSDAVIIQQDPAVTQQDPNGTTVTEQDSSAVIRKNASIGVMTTSEQDSNVAVPMLLNSSSDRTMIQDVNADIGMNAEVSGNEPQCDGFVVYEYDILVSNKPVKQPNSETEVLMTEQGSNVVMTQKDSNAATVTQSDVVMADQGSDSDAVIIQQDPAVTQQDPNGTTVTEQDSSAVIRKNASIGVMTTSEQDSNVAVPMLLNSSSDRTMIQDVNADIGMNAEVSGNEPQCDGFVVYEYDILVSNKPVKQPNSETEVLMTEQGSNVVMTQKDSNAATVTQSDVVMADQGSDSDAVIIQQDPAVTQQDPNGTTVTEQDSSAVIRKDASIGVMTTSEQDSNVAVPMLLNSSSDRTTIQDVNADIGMNAEVSGNEPQCDGFVVYEYDILVSNKPVKQPNSETEVLMTEQGSNVVMTQKDSNAATVTQSDVVMADQGSDSDAVIIQQDPAVTQQDPNGTTVTEQDSSAVIRKNASIGVMTTSEQDSNVAVPMLLNSSSDRTMIQDVNADIGMNAEVSGNEPQCDGFVVYEYDILVSNKPVKQPNSETEVLMTEQGSNVVMTQKDSNAATVTQSDVVMADQGSDSDAVIIQQDPAVTQQDPNGATVTQQDPGVTQQDPGVTQQDPGVTQQDPGVTQQDPGVTQQDPNCTTVTEQDSSAVIRKNASIGVMTTSEQDSNVAVPMLLNSSSDRTMIQDVNADILLNAWNVGVEFNVKDSSPEALLRSLMGLSDSDPYRLFAKDPMMGVTDTDTNAEEVAMEQSEDLEMFNEMFAAYSPMSITDMGTSAEIGMEQAEDIFPEDPVMCVTAMDVSAEIEMEVEGLGLFSELLARNPPMGMTDTDANADVAMEQVEEMCSQNPPMDVMETDANAGVAMEQVEELLARNPPMGMTDTDANADVAMEQVEEMCSQNPPMDVTETDANAGVAMEQVEELLGRNPPMGMTDTDANADVAMEQVEEMCSQNPPMDVTETDANAGVAMEQVEELLGRNPPMGMTDTDANADVAMEQVEEMCSQNPPMDVMETDANAGVAMEQVEDQGVFDGVGGTRTVAEMFPELFEALMNTTAVIGNIRVSAGMDAPGQAMVRYMLNHLRRLIDLEANEIEFIEKSCASEQANPNIDSGVCVSAPATEIIAPPSTNMGLDDFPWDDLLEDN